MIKYTRETYYEDLKMKKAFSWIFGCIFALLAISSLFHAQYVSFLFEAFIAVLLIPPANNYLKQGLKVNIPKWVTPTAITFYYIFVIAVGVINIYRVSAPFVQPFVRMSQEIASFDRQPLAGITLEQRESVEKYQAKISEFINKLKTLNQIQNKKLKQEMLLEYSADIKKLEVPRGLPSEIESLLVASKEDFNAAFEMIVKSEDLNQENMVKMINKIVDGCIKVSKASVLIGITPQKNK
jgi:hypothetical protein